MMLSAKQTATCITLSLFLSVCSTGCSLLHLPPYAGTEMLAIKEPSPQPQNPGIELDFLSKENREGEWVFSLAADDFITAYNSLYELDHGKPYLKPLSQWKHSVCENAPHSDYKTDYYIYQSNPDLASMPIVSIFIPSDSDCIQEITLGFDHHGYSDSWYEMYGEQCQYVLHLLLPDYGDEELADLFCELYDLAQRDDRCFFTNGLYTPSGIGSQITPPILYWRGNIGIYPCMINGGLLYINVIPVTEEYIEALTTNNIELHELSRSGLDK